MRENREIKLSSKTPAKSDQQINFHSEKHSFHINSSGFCKLVKAVKLKALFLYIFITVGKYNHLTVNDIEILACKDY